MIKRFILTRSLKVGMKGEDVKTLQKWLNIVNTSFKFSECFKEGIPENGQFQTFFLGIFYHEYLRHIGQPINHVYDQEIHEILCKHVNSVLFFKSWDTPEGIISNNATQWETKPYAAPDTRTFGF